MEIIENDSIIIRCDSCGAETKISSSEREKRPLYEFGYFGFKNKLFCKACCDRLLFPIIINK